MTAPASSRGEGYTLTCHCDGASRGNPGPAAAGVVVLDAAGRERRALSLPLGLATNNVAEYLALHAALRAAVDVCREDGQDPAKTSVIVRTDSQLMERQISGEYKVKSPDLAPLLATYRDLARPFFRVVVTHVLRGRNGRADRLANEALDALAAAGGSPSVAAGPRYSRLSHLECCRCGKRLEAGGLETSCPSCSGPLWVRYDLDGLVWPPSGFAGRDPEVNSMWRYHELLPVTSPQYVVSLGEGLTPLVPLPTLERELGLPRILVKEESFNPTGTFKARGASTAVSRLVELGAKKCAVPTAGNAGAAFAAYTARAGLPFLVAMPDDTPEAIKRECEGYGASVKTVPGLLPDAAAYIRDRAKVEGWFVASTFDEPYRVEGKKTIALELLESFEGRWPDAIVFPVGGGVALIGAWKAALEMSMIAGASARPPRLFAVQAEGCSPVVKAFATGQDETKPFEGARTVAAGLRVPNPKAGFLILRAIRATGGAAVEVPDSAILRTADRLRRSDGLNVCPEGAAAVAALPELVRRGMLHGCREVVVVNTGTGLKC